MPPRAKAVVTTFFGFVLAGLLVWLAYIILRGTWHRLLAVNENLAVAIVTVGGTIVTATGTVMLGRYYERKREIEVHFRTKKIEIYDEFLRELFKSFRSDENPEKNKSNGNVVDSHLVAFLHEWQQKVILWGGGDVLRAYIEWMNRLRQGSPDAQTVFLMDKFFRALRADIGQNSSRLPRGAFVSMILRHGDLFLDEARKNPRMTFAEFGKLEKERFGETTK